MLLIAALAWPIFLILFLFWLVTRKVTPLYAGAFTPGSYQAGGGSQPSNGTLIGLANLGSPQTYRPIANTDDLAWDMSNTETDVSSHTYGAPFRQQVPTFTDPGTITVKVWFIPSSAGDTGTTEGHDFTNGLGDVFINRQTRPMAWQCSDAALTTYYCMASISKYKINAPVKGVYSADVTFVMTGEPAVV